MYTRIRKESVKNPQRIRSFNIDRGLVELALVHQSPPEPAPDDLKDGFNLLYTERCTEVEYLESPTNGI